MIAERAGRNFLVAAMAAVPLSTARAMIDPATREFDPAEIPSGVGEALSKYLNRLPVDRRGRDRGLLTALGYARGAGLDDPGWLAFAAALGYGATVVDLDALRRSRLLTTSCRPPASSLAPASNSLLMHASPRWTTLAKARQASWCSGEDWIRGGA